MMRKKLTSKLKTLKFSIKSSQYWPKARRKFKLDYAKTKKYINDCIIFIFLYHNFDYLALVIFLYNKIDLKKMM